MNETLIQEILNRIKNIELGFERSKVIESVSSPVGGTGTAGRIAEWATASTLQASTLVKSGAGVLTLSAAGAYTLTVPATGTAALLGTANVFTDTNTFPNGSAAAPAIIFAASSTTGLFSAGVGDVSISSLGYRSAQFQTSGSKFRRASTGQFSAYQFTMYKASASDTAASNGDVLGDFSFNFVNSTPAEVQMGLWRTVIDTATAGSETLHFEFYLADSGSLAEKFRMQAAGNFLIGATSVGSSLAKGLVLANGTAPTTSITGTQLWSSTDGLNIAYTYNKNWTIGDKFGAFGTAAAAQQTVTGSRGGNAALASLLTALATYGLIVDSSSA